MCHARGCEHALNRSGRPRVVNTPTDLSTPPVGEGPPSPKGGVSKSVGSAPKRGVNKSVGSAPKRGGPWRTSRDPFWGRPGEITHQDGARKCRSMCGHVRTYSRGNRPTQTKQPTRKCCERQPFAKRYRPNNALESGNSPRSHPRVPHECPGNGLNCTFVGHGPSGPKPTAGGGTLQATESEKTKCGTNQTLSEKTQSQGVISAQPTFDNALR